MNPAIASLARKTTVREQVSAEEWRLRVELAACYRLALMMGWEDQIFTHFSARVPGPERYYLLNPLGYLFDEVTASSLVKVDAQGTIVLDPIGNGINPAGWVIHGAVHEARDDAHCVLHTHTIAGVAVSIQKEGLLPISQQALTIVGDLAYHDFEGIALDADEKVRLVADLGSKNNLILRNHGLLTTGDTIGAAFTRMYALSRTCEIQIQALAGGCALYPVDRAAIDRVAEQSRPSARINRNAALTWNAMVRRLDRHDQGYKD
jgi:ribulose-5-phosphate 4-epimerase/fuculose-1-phosphate aldolase